jgi:mono/diheme cytochrome c family protein
MTSRSSFLAIVVAAVAALGVLAGCGGGDDDGGSTATQGGGSTQTQSGATADGAALFESNCATCHTLAAAGATGQIGPNLDEIRPDVALVLATIRAGPGAMPTDLVTGAEARAVAQYVAQNAGR